MKRYEIGRDRGMGCFMEESPTGDYYSRADLIAAGCLVPVPDGEARLAWDSLEHSCVLYDGVLWKVSLDSESTVFMETVDGSRPSLNYVHGAGQPTVQPVRLVRLEDVG